MIAWRVVAGLSETFVPPTENKIWSNERLMFTKWPTGRYLPKVALNLPIASFRYS